MGLMVSAALLAGCSSSPKSVTAADKQYRFQVHTGPGGMLYSPNGEPLTGGPLGAPTCQEAMTRWFGLVDGNRDGFIDRTEFTEDARIQFNRMDRDHDGAIYPSELLSYREPFEVGLGREGTPVEDDQSSSSGDSDKKKKQAAIPDVSDPVMSADANLDFKVTLDELTTQAQDLFKIIDRNHDGKLDKAEVLATCPATDAE